LLQIGYAYNKSCALGGRVKIKIYNENKNNPVAFGWARTINQAFCLVFYL